MARNGEPLTELPLGLPGTLYRSPMPFGPYDRLNEIWAAYQAAGVSLVAVLVEPQEYLVHARRDLPAFYRTRGVEVVHHPIPDFGVPRDPAGFRTALKRVRAHLEGGGNAAVHCMAGIGRTGLFAACLARDVLALSPVEAIAWVRRRIPGAVESEPQARFVGVCGA